MSDGESQRSVGRVDSAIKRATPRLVMTALVLLFILVAFWDRIVIRIDSGHAGVLWRLMGGTVTYRAYGEGVHVIFPWHRMTIYETRYQQQTIATSMLTQNGINVSVRFSYRFRPVTSTLPALHQRFGVEYPERFVKPVAISAMRIEIGNRTEEQIYRANEGARVAEVLKSLRGHLAEGGVEVEDLTILEMRLPQRVSEAIESKQAQEQHTLEIRNKIEEERFEAERKEIEADGIRTFEKITQISALRWRGIDVTEKLASSPNAKIILMGTNADRLPILLDAASSTPSASSASSAAGQPKSTQPADAGAP